MGMFLRLGGLCAALLLASPLPAGAEDVDFSANLTNSCTLSLSNNGELGLSADGQTLGTEEGTGSPAAITVASVGSNTLTVGAPSLEQAPVDYAPAGHSLQVKYVGLDGLSTVSQDYTEQQTSVAIGAVALSTLTVHARVINPGSFAAGSYLARTVITCS